MNDPHDERIIMETAMPVDFSLKGFSKLEAVGAEGARQCRVGRVPERGANGKKYLTKAIWLNNNKLTEISNLDLLVNSVLEEPKELGWVDFSFNRIKKIDESLLKFPQLKIIYFHGNDIEDLEEVQKLRGLKELRSVTFHGNPIAELPKYRRFVVAVLPQIVNLDFSPVLKDEKLYPAPPEAVKLLRKLPTPKEDNKPEEV